MVFSEENAPKVRLIMEREMQSPGEETDDGLKWEQDGLTVVVTDRELMVSKKIAPERLRFEKVGRL